MRRSYLCLLLVMPAFPWVLENRHQAEITRCKVNLKTLANSLETYASHHNGAYPLRLNAPGACRYAYRVRTRPDAFTILCLTEGHASYSAEAVFTDHP